MNTAKSPASHAPRRRIGRLVLLLVAGFAALGLFYHRPQWKRYQQHQQQLEQLQQQAQALQQQNQQLGQVQHQLDQARRFLDRQHRGHLLVSVEELVGGLMGVFSGKEVQIRQFRRREVRKRAFLQEVWIDVDCRGSLPQVFHVVAELERLPQPVWIEQLELAPAGEHPQQVRCHLLLRGFAGNLQQSG